MRREGKIHVRGRRHGDRLSNQKRAALKVHKIGHVELLRTLQRHPHRAHSQVSASRLQIVWWQLERAADAAMVDPGQRILFTSADLAEETVLEAIDMSSAISV